MRGGVENLAEPPRLSAGRFIYLSLLKSKVGRRFSACRANALLCQRERAALAKSNEPTSR